MGLPRVAKSSVARSSVSGFAFRPRLVAVATALLMGILNVLAVPTAAAGCNAGKGFACWWAISTCAPASLGGADKYRQCVAALSNNWCTECIDAGPADPNCPVGSRMQGNVCIPFAQSALQISGPPGYTARSVAPNDDGRLELVAIDGNGAVSHLWQEGPSGPFVGASARFSGDVTAAAFPVLVKRLDGRLEALVVSRAGLISRAQQVAPNVNWGAWTAISSRRFKPLGLAAAVSPSGILVVAAIDPDGTLWYAHEREGQWSAWTQAGTMRFAGAPILANNADGRLEVFAIGADGHLNHAWQTAQDSPFGGWVSLAPGPFQGTPSAMRNLDQRLEVFATTKSGALAHVWQVAPNGAWSSEAQTQGSHRFDSAVHMNADGTLAVFVVGVADHAVWTRRQLAPNGSWGDWKSLGGVVASTPALGRNANGVLQIFAVGQDGAIWSSAQNAPSSTTWRPWARLDIRAAQM